MNEFLWLLEILVMYGLLYVANVLFGKKGLVFWIVLSYLFFMLFSESIFFVWGLSMNGGTIMFATAMVAMNMLLQKYGKGDISKLWQMVIIGLSVIYGGILLVNSFASDSELVSNLYFKGAFNISFRVYLALMLTSYVTIHFNSLLYYELRLWKNKIWISNLLSVIVCGFIESVLFSIIAFSGLISTMELISLIIVVTALKFIVGTIGTFLIYMNNKIG